MKKESEEELFCVLCKQKYSLEGYKQHISSHKRKKKPKINKLPQFERING